MTLLSFQTTVTGDVAVVALTGELDVAGVRRCSSTSSTASSPTTTPRALVLDLSGLDFMDSTGLRLDGAGRRARPRRRAARFALVRGPAGRAPRLRDHAHDGPAALPRLGRRGRLGGRGVTLRRSSSRASSTPPPPRGTRSTSWPAGCPRTSSATSACSSPSWSPTASATPSSARRTASASASTSTTRASASRCPTPGKGFELDGRADDPDTVEGWGLYLVATLADRWGVDARRTRPPTRSGSSSTACRVGATASRRSAFAPGRVNLLGEHTDYNGGARAAVRDRPRCHRAGHAAARRARAWPSRGDLARRTTSAARSGPRDGLAGVRARHGRPSSASRPARIEIAATCRAAAGCRPRRRSAARSRSRSAARTTPTGAIARVASRVENEWVGAPDGAARPVRVAARPGGPRAADRLRRGHRRARSARARRLAAGRRPRRLARPRLRRATTTAPRALPAAEHARMAESERGARRRRRPAPATSPPSARCSTPRTPRCATLGVSTDEVERVVARLQGAGAAGARLIGGGFGGHVLALFAPGLKPPSGTRVVRPRAGRPGCADEDDPAAARRDERHAVDAGRPRRLPAGSGRWPARSSPQDDLELELRQRGADAAPHAAAERRQPVGGGRSPSRCRSGRNTLRVRPQVGGEVRGAEHRAANAPSGTGLAAELGVRDRGADRVDAPAPVGASTP